MSATAERDAWTGRLPNRERLRGEVHAMAHAVRDVVLRELGHEQVRGIYHKGSGHKPWDTAIDYVPEISDVDVHVWLHDAEGERCLRDIETALRVQSAIEYAYARAVPEAIHLPRPQVIVLNRLLEYDDYVPSPPQIVEVLHGEPYPQAGSKPDDEVRAIDRANLLKMDDEVANFGLSALDKPGRHVWSVVRQLAWKVSPTGTRALTVLGVPPAQAWSMNRSAVAHTLEERGRPALAEAMRDYYLAGWDYFLSGFADTDAARAVMRHGLLLIRLGAQVARAGAPP